MKSFLLVAVFAASIPAHGALITYTGSVDPAARGTWQLTTLQGSFEEYSSQLTRQIWFGNGALARQFAELLGDELGFPNQDGAGPIFAWEYDLLTVSPINARAVFSHDPAVAVGIGTGNTDVLTWAVATPVPEPSALSLIGLGIVGLIITRRRTMATVSS